MRYRPLAVYHFGEYRVAQHIQREVESALRKGQYRDALHAISRIGSKTAEAQLLLARLLQLTGDNRGAEQLVQAVQKHVRGQPALVLSCEEVLGAVAVDDGQFTQAVEHYQQAAVVAESLKDLDALCRCQLRLLTSLAELGGPAAVSPLLTSLRRNVLRTGDTHHLALLHSQVAQLEAKRGMLELALRHLRCGSALMDLEPNFFILGSLALNGSTVAALQGDLHSAIALAERAVAASGRSGHSRTRVAAVANLCGLHLQVGAFAKADEFVRLGLSEGKQFPRVHVAILDNAAQLAVLRGRLESGQRLLEEVKTWSEATGQIKSWFYLSVYQSRVRIEQQRQDWPRALELAQEAFGLAQERCDPYFLTRFALDQIDSLLSLDRPSEAIALWKSLGSDAPKAGLTLLSDSERIAGRLALAHHDRTRAIDHFHRASRLAGVLGDSWAKQSLLNTVECGRRLADMEAAGEDVPFGYSEWTPTPLRSEPESPLDAATIGAVANLMQVSSHPEMLGRESISLLHRANCVSSYCLVVSSDTGPTDVLAGSSVLKRSPAALRARLGTAGDREYELIVQPRDDARSHGAALAVIQLVNALVAVEGSRREQQTRVSLWQPEAELEIGDGFVVSTVMREVVSAAHRVATTGYPVLVTGETGVGKEVLAREIHRRSPYCRGPFLAFNCTSVPREMLDSQLFGYHRGAFTGAHDNFPGVIRAAGGGTLFLDEIGELPLDVQPKLLRFLETSEVHPLGETKPVKVDVRVVAATNAPLEQHLRDGRFREDLYYRLNVVRLHVPALRERREEIPPLAEHFLERYCRELGKHVLQLSDEVLEYLVLFHWPGNIRQLANEIRRIVALAPPDVVVVPGMLSTEILASRRTVPVAEKTIAPNDIVVRVDQPLEDAVRYLEHAMIDRAMAVADGHLETAAAILGVSRKGLFLKRKRLSAD